jgi:hypothetical protein
MSERFSPLMALAGKLLDKRIPSLSSLMVRLEESEDYADFVNLVKTYLPEHQGAILGEPTPASQMAAFASRFEDRYFPLEEPARDGMLESYSEITRSIPVVSLVLSYDEYHEIPEYYRAGCQLMTCLIRNPWDDDTVALAEACAEHVPKGLVERAGRAALSPEEAKELLKGTKYEPLAMWAERLYQSTGNFFLDTDYECLYGGYAPGWDPEEVEELTRMWREAEAHESKTGDFMNWLEGDLPGRFEELVSIIEGRGKDEKKAPG